jgi:hypothetical protein
MPFHFYVISITVLEISQHFQNVQSSYLSIFIPVRFEVFTAVTVKNAVFWDVAPCRYCVNRRFGGTYRLHLHGREILEGGTSVSRSLEDFSALKTEAIHSSETSVYTRPTHPRRRHSYFYSCCSLL